MPICKNCGSRIDKFNKDRCPICGAENPFEGVSSETVEVTTSIDVDSKDYHPRKRSTLLLLFPLTGFLGIPYFYLHENKLGAIYAILNLAGIGLIGFLLGFYTGVGFLIGYIIAIAIFIVLNFGLGLYYFYLPNLKDGRGDFVI